MNSSEHFFKELNKITDVSRETFESLEEYVSLLCKWNQSMNLIGKATEREIWQRHIIDSLQLIPLFPKEYKTITDIGSGGGLPGIVLAISTKKVTHLIESNQKKAIFLNQASSLCQKNIHIHNNRVESLSPWESDILTARAFAPLEKIFEWSGDFIKKSKICLFLKGQNVVEEITEASRCWDFEYEIIQSQTSNNGKILRVHNLKKKP